MTALAILGPGEPRIGAARVRVPRIEPDELLVRVKAVGVGIHDSYFLPRERSFPFPIGIEAAGLVEEVGSAVVDHRPGDRITFVSTMQPKGGVWAEFAAVRADSLILPVPEDMTFEQAAAVPVAGNTTLRAFHALPSIPSGEALFVAGASGAIGTFAVQLAQQRGWQVAASTSRHNHDYLTALGAVHTVDYHDHDWPEQVRRWRPEGVAGALAVQPDTTADTMRVVRDGGTVVTVSGDTTGPVRGVTVTGVAYGADIRSELTALMNDIVSGALMLTVERVYPFSDALSALAKVQTRRARGKVVLTLD